MCPTFPPLLPLPLVSLRFGSSSVLDTLVLDVDDSHSTLRPLFSIETADDDTSVYRLDHDAHPDPTARLSAAIKWSSTSNKTLVSINGSTHFSSTFLKKTVLGGSRKFHVPGQSNALKWKHVGSHYECTLCSHACTMHRAVATLEPGHTTALPRLSIYTSSVLPHTSHQSESYKGVDVSLLEYLIVTTILLLRKDHSGHNTPSTTVKNSSQFLAPTTPTTISSSSSGSYSPLFSTSPAVACQRSTSTRSTRSGGQRTPGTRPVLDLLEDEDVPSPTTPYSPNKPQSPMLKPVTNSPRMRASPLLKPLSACPSPFSSASSSSSVAGGSVSSLPASPVTPFSHIGVHSPLNQDTFATANYQVLNGSHRDPRAESVEEPTVPFQIPLPASHEHRTLSHSASYGQLRSPTSASSSSTATFTQSPLTYIPFTSPSTHYAAPTPASPSTHVSTQNVASQRTYAPTPTRPPASSTNNSASAGHAMGRSHSHGAIPRKIANKLPSPILSSLAFFHHHSHSQSTKSTSTSGHGKSNSRARTNDDEREREPEPGPGAITPYQLPPTPSHPPPPPPSAPASMTTYATHVQAYSASMSSGSGSTLSRDPTITPYTLPPFSPRTQATNSVPPQGENALLLETDTNTSSLSGSSSGPDRSGPSPLQYTTEMYHIMFETGQYASSSASATMPQQRRESLSSSQHRRESSTTMTQHNQQHTRRESMPAQPRRDSASASGASRPTRIFQEVPAPSASDLEALGIADFFGTGSRSHSSPRAAQPHPLLQSSPRPAQPHLTLLNTNNGPSSPRLETHSRSPITRTVPIDDFEQLGVDDRAIDLETEERGNGNGEALPSYNEIEWTVRVRQPRVRERQANAHAHNERTFAAHGQDGVLGLALVH